MSAPTTSPLRHILEERLSGLMLDLDSVCNSLLAAATAEARETAAREIAEQLNQAARRIRSAEGSAELGAILLDAAASFAGGVALLGVGGDMVWVERIRGAPGPMPDVRVPLASAAAVAHAVETGDPVIAMAAPPEMPDILTVLLPESPDGRVYLFPVVVRDRVPALLYARGTVQGAVLELLCQVAGGALGMIPEPAPEIVEVEPMSQQPVQPTWEELSAEEQQVHLRAQRFARVQVAEIRLFEPDAVQSGRAQRDLYDALSRRIDPLREAFRQTYFGACPSMVDYLHLELVRTLANDDAELLGDNYPGPMV